jgi:hypothetical protein
VHRHRLFNYELDATPILGGEGNLDSEVARVLDFLNKCDRGLFQTQAARAELSYDQLFSMHQIRKLDKNLNYLAQQETPRNPQSPVAGIFAEDEGSLCFDGF